VELVQDLQDMDLAVVVVPVVMVLMDLLLDKQQLLEVLEHQIVFWGPITSGLVAAVVSTTVVMEEQVAPEVVVEEEQLLVLLLVQVELVDYLMDKMEL